MGTRGTEGWGMALERLPAAPAAMLEASPDVSTDTTGSGQPASVKTYLTTTFVLQSAWGLDSGVHGGSAVELRARRGRRADGLGSSQPAEVGPEDHAPRPQDESFPVGDDKGPRHPS